MLRETSASLRPFRVDKGIDFGLRQRSDAFDYFLFRVANGQLVVHLHGEELGPEVEVLPAVQLCHAVRQEQPVPSLVDEERLLQDRHRCCCRDSFFLSSRLQHEDTKDVANQGPCLLGRELPGFGGCIARLLEDGGEVFAELLAEGLLSEFCLGLGDVCLLDAETREPSDDVLGKLGVDWCQIARSRCCRVPWSEKASSGLERKNESDANRMRVSESR